MTEAGILEGSLSARTCPEHHGVQLRRVGEHTWQCDLDKKNYNYQTGFTMANGVKIPGGDVANQQKWNLLSHIHYSIIVKAALADISHK